MIDRKTLRLSKMNLASEKGNFIHIYSSYMSLFDMINEQADDYPSTALIMKTHSMIKKKELNLTIFLNSLIILNSLKLNLEIVLASGKKILFVFTKI